MHYRWMVMLDFICMSSFELPQTMWKYMYQIDYGCVHAKFCKTVLDKIYIWLKEMQIMSDNLFHYTSNMINLIQVLPGV